MNSNSFNIRHGQSHYLEKWQCEIKLDLRASFIQDTETFTLTKWSWTNLLRHLLHRQDTALLCSSSLVKRESDDSNARLRNRSIKFGTITRRPSVWHNWRTAGEINANVTPMTGPNVNPRPKNAVVLLLVWHRNNEIMSANVVVFCGFIWSSMNKCDVGKWFELLQSWSWKERGGVCLSFK